MAISLDAFVQLPFPHQVQAVWLEGHHLAHRYEEEDTVALYHMPTGFFVELFYNNDDNVLQQYLRTFTDPEYLLDYATGLCYWTMLLDYACYVNLKDLTLE